MPLVLALLFLVNVLICRELFHREFTTHMGAIEGSYMSIPRWELAHPGAKWFPLWFAGMPVIQAYSPGLPGVIRGIVNVSGWSVQHAYHFLVATSYSLTAVALATLLYAGSRSVLTAGLGGFLCSTYSAVSALVPLIRADDGGRLVGRRLYVLLAYGEGPHTTVVALIPVAILVLDQAIIQRRRWALLIAPFLVASLPLVNWPGTVGFSMALAAYCVARLELIARPKTFLTLLGCLVAAYFIASPWMPPSLIALIQRNAQLSADAILGPKKLLLLAALPGTLLIADVAFKKLRIEPWLRFWIYFVLLTGVVTLAHEWFGWSLLPQANRFQLEFDVAASGLIAWICILAIGRTQGFARYAAVAFVVIVCVLGAIKTRRYARGEQRALDISQTIEYRMAKWFDHEMGGARVFAPGNVSLWMNMFTDTPQMQGCCDPGIPVQTHRIAGYTIYTGQNAGVDDARISILWLKAYGVDAIGVSGPRSTEFFHPFWHPAKFNGVLPVLWRDGDNAVYAVPKVQKSLAHVVSPDSIVTRQPDNGLQVEAIERYVSAIESRDSPKASFTWLDSDHAVIRAAALPEQAISAQITYDPGWRASVQGTNVPMHSDALGLLVIQPRCSGVCVVQLDWTGTHELQLAGFAQWITVIGWSALCFVPAFARL